jgi:hypothetical protein
VQYVVKGYMRKIASKFELVFASYRLFLIGAGQILSSHKAISRKEQKLSFNTFRMEIGSSSFLLQIYKYFEDDDVSLGFPAIGG